MSRAEDLSPRQDKAAPGAEPQTSPESTSHPESAPDSGPAGEGRGADEAGHKQGLDSVPTTHFANSGVGPTAESFPRRWHELRQPSIAGEARRLRAVVEEQCWVWTAAREVWVLTCVRCLPTPRRLRGLQRTGSTVPAGGQASRIIHTQGASWGCTQEPTPGGLRLLATSTGGSSESPPASGSSGKRPPHPPPPCKARAGKGQAPSLSQAVVLIPEAPGPGPPPKQGSASMTKGQSAPVRKAALGSARPLRCQHPGSRKVDPWDVPAFLRAHQQYARQPPCSRTSLTGHF